MIYSTTGRDPFDFSDYGNWCGLGGNGSVVDAIDEYVILYCWTTDYKKKNPGGNGDRIIEKSTINENLIYIFDVLNGRICVPG